MKIVPLGEHVIVKPDEQPEQTEGGIVLPEIARRERVLLGRVLSVGDGQRLPNGTLVPVEVHEGDRVLFPDWAGEELSLNGEKLRVLRAGEILARVT